MLTFVGHKGSALWTTVELLAGPLIDDMICKESKAFDGGLVVARKCLSLPGQLKTTQCPRRHADQTMARS